MSLFEHCLIVRLDEEAAGGGVKPVIAYSISAPHAGPIPKSAPLFCFPDVDLISKTAGLEFEAEAFTFALTESNATRLYGFCRRFLPVGASPRLPICICMIVKEPLFTVHNELLDCVQVRWLIQPAAVWPFLESLLGVPVPKPGELVRLRTARLSVAATNTSSSSSASGSMGLDGAGSFPSSTSGGGGGGGGSLVDGPTLSHDQMAFQRPGVASSSVDLSVLLACLSGTVRKEREQ